MWTRELLKTNAKQALQGRYWRSFWICLVLSFVGLGGAGANSGSAAHQAVSTVTDDTTAYDIVNSIPDSMLGAIFVGMLIGSIAALCWALFVVYPLNVGRCRYFMESRQSLTPVSTVVSTFRPLRQPHRGAVAYRPENRAGLPVAHCAGHLLGVLL